MMTLEGYLEAWRAQMVEVESLLVAGAPLQAVMDAVTKLTAAQQAYRDAIVRVREWRSRAQWALLEAANAEFARLDEEREALYHASQFDAGAVLAIHQKAELVRLAYDAALTEVLERSYAPLSSFGCAQDAA